MAPGLISTTADMWTADTTKAAFLGVTAHWIEVKMEPKETWELRSEVISVRRPQRGELGPLLRGCLRSDWDNECRTI